MENNKINEIIVDKLKSQVSGVVVMQSDPTYHEDRKLYNAMIEKYPKAIVKCANVTDVKHTVNFCRENRLLAAIRSGGHNGAGLGSCNDGIVIDLSLMKDIHIDPGKKTAWVEAGCLLGELDEATSVFGLAVPTGIFSTTGVAGLTLGGGLGYLTRKYGLTIDNLLEANMVLADGQYVTANESENSDLFWAIRGGGGNFGVVTSFLFQLQPVNQVYAGPIFWEVDSAKEVMQFYRNYMKTAPPDMYGFFTLMIIPASEPFPKEVWNKNVCAIIWNYTGEIEKASEVFKPIREFATPVLDFAGPIPFKNLQSMFDAIYPPGLHWYWKADYLNELSDEVIEASIQYGTKIPTSLSQTHIYPIDGFAESISKDATAWNYRDAKFAQVIVAVNPVKDEMEKAVDWCKSFWEAIHPHSAGGAYSNFMMEEGLERVKAAYGDNYKRLAQVKLKYDADNFFRVNQNVEPATKEAQAV